MRYSLLFCSAGIAVLSACHHAKVPEAPIAKPEPVFEMKPLDPSFKLYTDNVLGFADSARIIVRDTIVMRETWNQATKGQPTPLPMPIIDFNKELVVVAAGGRLKPGDVVSVDSIGTRGAATVVVVRTSIACQPFPSDAFPFEIVKIPRLNGPIHFVEHHIRPQDCP